MPLDVASMGSCLNQSSLKKSVIFELIKNDCCLRCCFRLMGVKSHTIYCQPTSVIRELALHIADEVAPKWSPPYTCSPEIKAKISQSGTGAPGNDNVCVCCIGVLPKMCPDSGPSGCSSVLAQLVQAKGYEVRNDFQIAVTIPLAVQVREHALWHHLATLAPSLDESERTSAHGFELARTHAVTVREVSQWVLRTQLPMLFNGAQHKIESVLAMRVLFDFVHNDQEVNRLGIEVPKDHKVSRKKRRMTTTAAPLVAAQKFSTATRPKVRPSSAPGDTRQCLPTLVRAGGKLPGKCFQTRPSRKRGRSVPAHICVCR
jgi:hypothetical protein